MGVTKINGFRAPYRSGTFQNQAGSLANRNGVVSMEGVVSESGGTVTIPAFTFIQQGLIVTKDLATLVSTSSLDAPFYITVSAATSAEVDDLAFQFARSPLDISENEVIIAEFDGEEWRMLPFVSVDGIYRDVNLANADFNLVGPFKGLQTSYNGPNYENTPGVVVDKQGLRRRLEETAIFSEALAESEATWERVDRIIYRRPEDGENRIGIRKFELGGSYHPAGPAKVNQTAPYGGTTPRVDIRTVIASDNTAHVFAASGYGDAFELVYTKYDADRSAQVVAPLTLFTMSESDFDLVIDKNDEMHVLYINDGDVEHRKFDLSGAAVGGATVVDGDANASSRPRASVDQFSTNIFVAYQRLEGANNNQAFFAKLTLGGSVATAPKNITGTGANLENPDIFVNSDLWVYVAWQDSVSGKVYYQSFDDVGDPLNSSVPIQISGNTDKIGGGTLVDVASKPKIWVTDNKSVIVTFLQDKGGSVFGLSLWQDGSASMLDLVSGGENFDKHSLFVDSIHNGIHVLVGQAAQVDYVKVEYLTVKFVISIAVTATQGIHTTRDKTGSMFHVWTDAASGSFTNYDTGLVVNHIGPNPTTGTLNLPLNSDEMTIAFGAPSQPPKSGDRVTITGTGGNNGTYSVISVSVVGVELPGDSYKIRVTPIFSVAESPAVGVTTSLGTPDGNGANFVKSTSELKAEAFRFTELASDILLARIVLPGPVILNYIPGGGSSTVNSDTFTPFGAASIDWESTTAGELTISSGLKLIDLVNNQTYSLVDAGFPMVEDDALYVTLDGVDLTPTPQVTSIATLPFGTPIQVLGIIKDNQFAPQLLGVAGMGALESGESVLIDNDLPQPVRAKLGIATDTSLVPYSFNIGHSLADSYPVAIGQNSLMAGQNKHIRLIKGRVSWEEVTADTLTFNTEGFLSVPGLTDARNRIAPQDVVLDANDKVAYVSINRVAGAAADLSVSVAVLSSLTLTRDTMILARRINGVIVMGPVTIKSGHKVDIEDTFDVPLKLKEHPTDSTKVIVQASDALKSNSSSLSQTLRDLLLQFDGAQINTVTGAVFEADGTTPLGDDYVPPTIAASQFRWISVSLVSNGTTADNRISTKLAVGIGSADGATTDAAAKAIFTGDIPVGQFFLQRNIGDTAHEAITAANFRHTPPKTDGLVAIQNKHIRMIKARISWEETTADTFTFHKEGFLSVPGLAEARNRIAPQDIVLDADDKVAHVEVNRHSGATANLTVNVTAISSLVLTRNTVILARRVSGSLVMEVGGLTLNSGFKVSIDDPFNIPLKIKEHPTDQTRVVVQSSDALRTNGSLLSQTISSLLVKFDGAQIDTVTGIIYEADGTTPLGNNYVVPTIAASQFRWFSVNLIGDAQTSDGRISAKIIVGIGDSEGANADAAKKGVFLGDLPIGQFFLQRNAGGTAHEAITEANFRHLSPGAGGGGGGAGGSAVKWNPPQGFAPVRDEENGELVYLYESSLDNRLTAYVKIPEGHLSSNKIRMKIALYSPSISNTILLSTISNLVKKEVDAISSITNQHNSSNIALTNTAPADRYREVELDLTDAAGLVNGVAAEEGDILRVDLSRGADTDIEDLRFIPSATEVFF